MTEKYLYIAIVDVSEDKKSKINCNVLLPGARRGTRLLKSKLLKNAVRVIEANGEYSVSNKDFISSVYTKTVSTNHTLISMKTISGYKHNEIRTGSTEDENQDVIDLIAWDRMTDFLIGKFEFILQWALKGLKR